MDLTTPLLDVAPAVRGALLQALTRLEAPVTRRQLANLARVAPGHASSVLQDLIELGIVDETTAGRASLVSLNRDHLATHAVLELANLRSTFIARLRERVSMIPGLCEAWLFGSVARGDAGRASDIDLLLVLDDLDSADVHDHLTRLHTDVRSWTGNHLQVLEHTPSSWRRLVRSENPLVAEIHTHGIPLTATVTAPRRPRR